MRKKPEYLDTDAVRPGCRAKSGVSKENGIHPVRPDVSLRARALQYLARREYGRAELRAKLLKYVPVEEGLEPVATAGLDELLDDLTARGWLSDARATTQLVHAKRSRFGAQRITHELRQRGIAEELISAALPALKETELDAAREVWRKKFGAAPQDAKEKARQMRFLQSRGFSLDTIFRVLKLSSATEDMGG